MQRFQWLMPVCKKDFSTAGADGFGIPDRRSIKRRWRKWNRKPCKTLWFQNWWIILKVAWLMFTIWQNIMGILRNFEYNNIADRDGFEDWIFHGKIPVFFFIPESVRRLCEWKGWKIKRIWINFFLIQFEIFIFFLFKF